MSSSSESSKLSHPIILMLGNSCFAKAASGGNIPTLHVHLDKVLMLAYARFSTLHSSMDPIRLPLGSDQTIGV